MKPSPLSPIENKEEQILFIVPPGRDTPFFEEHLGVAFLQTILAQSGIASSQYLPSHNPSPAVLARSLAEKNYPVVGFTVYDSNIDGCRVLSRLVRQVLPESFILCGGPSSTFSPREVMARVEADICFRGAGEGRISPLMELLLQHQRQQEELFAALSPLPNLVYQTPEGLQYTEEASLASFQQEHFSSLDDIPSPYQAGLLTTTDVGLLTARGCNQHCTYCNFAALSKKRIHFHSIERVLDDIAALKELAIRQDLLERGVPIYDDTFTLNPGRVRKICQGILDRGLQMKFNCMTRGDRVDRELLRLMKEAGIVSIGFGLESAVPRVLRKIGKLMDPNTPTDPAYEAERHYLEQCRRSVEAAKEEGMQVNVSIIAGLPGESKEDLQTTLSFVKSLQVPLYFHNYLRVWPGTPLYSTYHQDGLKVEEARRETIFSTSYPYPVEKIAPLPNSSQHLKRWTEVHLITDALSGRTRPEKGDKESAWAVVLDEGQALDEEVISWLPEVLALYGVLVLVDQPGDISPGKVEELWCSLVDRGLLLGQLALLSRKKDGTADHFLSRGTLGEHHFHLLEELPPSLEKNLQRTPYGDCKLSVLVLPKGEPLSPALFQGNYGGFHLADCCHWWEKEPRCPEARVLHVDREKKVRPCWQGLVLGRVGDSYEALQAQAQSLQQEQEKTKKPQPTCPLLQNKDKAPFSSFSSQVSPLDEEAQYAWFLGYYPYPPPGFKIT